MAVERIVLHSNLKAQGTNKYLPSMWIVQIIMEEEHSYIDLSLSMATGSQKGPWKAATAIRPPLREMSPVTSTHKADNYHH